MEGRTFAKENETDNLVRVYDWLRLPISLANRFEFDPINHATS